MNGHRLKADLSIITSIRLYLEFRSNEMTMTKATLRLEASVPEYDH